MSAEPSAGRPANARDQAPFVRTFLAQPSGPPLARPVAPRTDTGVRPYLLTGGRTDVADQSLGFETILAWTAHGEAAFSQLRYEHRQIALLCAAGPLSVAEISAKLPVPIGVARILAFDMASIGLLQLHEGPSNVTDDVHLIKRLIHGVRAL